MIPTIAQIYGVHQPDTSTGPITGCVGCPDVKHTTWAEHADHVQQKIADTLRIDTMSDLRSLPDETVAVDTLGNVITTGPLYIHGEVEFPVWILPRVDLIGRDQ
ncbi:hypothetical protein [Gordonia sp. (in: high G+C Gram-positive bacteria)]|uniref:hypothetical protein n=1 Tax=Gordonia sp. (in: high G+C Gram-positive bacteria) TaxID=84139 RepID=UPI003342B543